MVKRKRYKIRKVSRKEAKEMWEHWKLQDKLERKEARWSF